MNRETKEHWLIPIVITVSSGVIFLYVNAWATGTPLRYPFTLVWIKAVFESRLPFWGALLFGASTAILALYIRHRTEKHSSGVSAAKGGSALSNAAADALHLRPTEAKNNLGRPRPPLAPSVAGTLVFESSDLFAVRLSTVELQQLRGVQLHVENYRLTSIQQTSVVLVSACSFDVRHQDFREAIITDQKFSRQNTIRASSSGEAITLLWKDSRWPSIVTGENNMVRRLIWPDTDKSKIERWRLSLKIQLYNQTANAHEKSDPLQEMQIELVVIWDRDHNTFTLRSLLK